MPRVNFGKRISKPEPSPSEKNMDNSKFQEKAITPIIVEPDNDIEIKIETPDPLDITSGLEIDNNKTENLRSDIISDIHTVKTENLSPDSNQTVQSISSYKINTSQSSSGNTNTCFIPLNLCTCIVKSCYFSNPVCVVKHNASFIPLPDDPTLCVRWLTAINRLDLAPYLNSKKFNMLICSRHFPGSPWTKPDTDPNAFYSFSLPVLNPSDDYSSSKTSKDAIENNFPLISTYKLNPRYEEFKYKILFTSMKSLPDPGVLVLSSDSHKPKNIHKTMVEIKAENKKLKEILKNIDQLDLLELERLSSEDENILENESDKSVDNTEDNINSFHNHLHLKTHPTFLQLQERAKVYQRLLQTCAHKESQLKKEVKELEKVNEFKSEDQLRNVMLNFAAKYLNSMQLSWLKAQLMSEEDRKSDKWPLQYKILSISLLNLSKNVYDLCQRIFGLPASHLVEKWSESWTDVTSVNSTIDAIIKVAFPQPTPTEKSNDVENNMQNHSDDDYIYYDEGGAAAEMEIIFSESENEDEIKENNGQ